MDSSPSRHAIACTSNPHKVEELAALLPDFAFEPLPAGTQLPPEIGSRFVDNARIKAHAGHALYPDHWVIADDSGIAVDALDGEPGVRSARFAGDDATDAENVELMLRKLEKVPTEERTARFVCVLVMIAPDGTETTATGLVEGTIAEVASGSQGFGYDPIFIPVGETATFGELGADVKSRMSHRARAARELQTLLLAHA